MRRVVITGLGLVTPIGAGKEAFWQAVTAGQCAVGPVTCFDTSAYRCKNGCEIKDFRIEDYSADKFARQVGRASQLAIAASKLALEDAQLDLQQVNHERVSVSLGTTGGEIQILERLDHMRLGHEKLLRQLIPRHPCHNISANVALQYNLKGPNYMVPTACAAGNYAIGYAFDLIRLGRVDLALAGGVDPFSKVAFTGFLRLGAMAPDICQPYDKNRKGMMVGEGAGVLVLETLASARARGAHIYAEIMGYGLSCDAYHMTSPEPNGNGVQLAMQRALENAGITPAQVDYISSHGTGTPTNDERESIAIEKVFGEYAHKIPVSSIKSMIGHTMGAASAIEAITCALVIERHVIPPTINYQTPDPACRLDYVPNVKRCQQVNVALNNAFAFGGNNSCLALQAFKPA